MRLDSVVDTFCECYVIRIELADDNAFMVTHASMQFDKVSPV